MVKGKNISSGVGKDEPIILRQTKGLCFVCRKEVSAVVFSRGGYVWLSKSCPDHGVQEDLLGRADHYVDLEDYFNKLIIKGSGAVSRSVELQVTFRCNMDCKICYLGSFKKHLINYDPSLEEIEAAIKESKCKVFVISGAEATCREDLFDIIRIFKKHNKLVGINTNGLKIADRDYACRLKSAGIDEVTVQFSGFDPTAEEWLRGGNFIDHKLKALSNLESLGISTRINMLVAKGINDNQMSGLVNYVLRSGFIKMVNFGAVQFVGNASGLSKEHYIMPDEMLSNLERETSGLISRDSVYILKKLELAISSLRNRPACLYNLFFLLIRIGNTYEPIDKVINLKSVEKCLDNYRWLFGRSRFFAKVYLLMMFGFSFILYVKRWDAFMDLLAAGLSYLSGKDYFSRSKLLVYLVFSAECDPCRMDAAVHNNCPHKFMLFFDRFNGQYVKSEKPVVSTNWLLWQ